MLEERLIRYAAPALYERMVDTFSDCHLHTFDVQATVIKGEKGYEVSLRFAHDFSQGTTKQFSFEQVKEPDDEVTLFFQTAAKECQASLIADYYKMMKP